MKVTSPKINTLSGSKRSNVKLRKVETEKPSKSKYFFGKKEILAKKREETNAPVHVLSVYFLKLLFI
jgi:hypothetical protein